MMIVPPPPPSSDVPTDLDVDYSSMQTYPYFSNPESFETPAYIEHPETLQSEILFESNVSHWSPDSEEYRTSLLENKGGSLMLPLTKLSSQWIDSSNTSTAESSTSETLNNRSDAAANDQIRPRYQKNNQNILRNFGLKPPVPDVTFVARPTRTPVASYAGGRSVNLPTCFESDETEDLFLQKLLGQQIGISGNVQRDACVEQPCFDGLNSKVSVRADSPATLLSEDDAVTSFASQSSEKHTGVVYRQKHNLNDQSDASKTVDYVPSLLNQRNIYSIEAMSKVKPRPMSEISPASSNRWEISRQSDDIREGCRRKSRDDSDLPQLSEGKKGNKHTRDFGTVVFREKKGKYSSHKIDQNSPRAQSLMSLYDPPSSGSLQDLTKMKKLKQHGEGLGSPDFGKTKKLDNFRSKLTSAKTQSLLIEPSVGEYGSNWEVQRSDYMTPVHNFEVKASAGSKLGTRYGNSVSSLPGKRLSVSYLQVLTDDALEVEDSRRYNATSFSTFRGVINPVKWSDDTPKLVSQKRNSYNPYRPPASAPVTASRRSVMFPVICPSVSMTTDPLMNLATRAIPTTVPEIPSFTAEKKTLHNNTVQVVDIKSTQNKPILSDTLSNTGKQFEKSKSDSGTDVCDARSVTSSHTSCSNVSLEKIVEDPLDPVGVATVKYPATGSLDVETECECKRAIDDMNILIDWLKEVKEKHLSDASTGGNSTATYSGDDQKNNDLSKRIRDFELYKNALFTCSRQLVTNCKCMVRGATHYRDDCVKSIALCSGDNLKKSVASCIENMTAMYDSCDAILKLIVAPDVQLGLIDSVLDISEVLCSTLIAANMAVTDTQSDVALEALMRQATLLAVALARHMETIKFLAFQIGPNDSCLTERL